MPELTRRDFLKLAGVASCAAVLAGLVDLGDKKVKAERENADLTQRLLEFTGLTLDMDRETLARQGYHAQFENSEMGANLDFGTWHGPRGPINIKTNNMGELPMSPGYTSKYPDFPTPNTIERYATDNQPKIYTYGSPGTADRTNQPALFALSKIFSTIPTRIPGEVHINWISKALSTGLIYETSNPPVYAPGLALVNQRFETIGPDFAASNIVVQNDQPTSLIGFQVFLNLDMLHKYALETGLTYKQACWLAIANEYANILACTPNPGEAARLGRQNGSESMSTAMGWLAALAPDYRSAILGQVDIKTVQIGVNLLAEEMSILAKLN